MSESNAQTASEANASSTGAPDNLMHDESVLVKFRLVQATREHAAEIAQNMRKADRDALYASGNLLHGPSFLRCIENDWPTWAVLNEEGGRVVALGGVAKTDCLYVGVPWMATTDTIAKHPESFMRIGHELLSEMHTRFPFLANWVDARNTEHIYWLKSLGFSFGMPLPFGVNGELFFPYMRVVGCGAH